MSETVGRKGKLILCKKYKDTEHSRNIEARCKSLGGQMGYSKCYKDGKEI